ncbi:phosphotransferase [Nonomuraea roseoviolacea]|uniref:phosphotransferase n=1 Tax=Nonomuraea roseoviolacea TaxID=103837 RepID=UPI003B598B06
MPRRHRDGRDASAEAVPQAWSLRSKPVRPGPACCVVRVLSRRGPRPSRRIRCLHLDLHPENVMLTPEGPMVVDRADASEGSPALDWGMSALILAEAAVSRRADASLRSLGLPTRTGRASVSRGRARVRPASR